MSDNIAIKKLHPTMLLINNNDFPSIPEINQRLFDQHISTPHTLKHIKKTVSTTCSTVSFCESSKEWKDIDSVSSECKNNIDGFTDITDEDGDRILTAPFQHCTFYYHSKTNNVTIRFTSSIVEKLCLRSDVVKKSNGHWRNAEILIAYNNRLEYASKWWDDVELWEKGRMNSDIAMLREIKEIMGRFENTYEYKLSIRLDSMELCLSRGSHKLSFWSDKFEERYILNDSTWKADLNTALAQFAIFALKKTRIEIAEKEEYCKQIVEKSKIATDQLRS